jgi:hypothetical protein
MPSDLSRIFAWIIGARVRDIYFCSPRPPPPPPPPPPTTHQSRDLDQLFKTLTFSLEVQASHRN